MMEIVIATKNKGKAKEFERLFSKHGFAVKTLLDFPEIEDIDETGKTFEENAKLKAEAVSGKLDRVVIADDSGLMVDALDGQPGIYSARYAGLDKNDDANMDEVLAQLQNVPEEKRTARFYCALAVAIPGKQTYTVFGTCEGRILTERRGSNGFGYDPIFYVLEKGLAMAELSSEEKNAISHRAKALQKLEGELNTIFASESANE
ncbi:XTP/dITP diphosphatase [Neobacillus sp. D3-1R]|uniref:XTP/dITP diphosphatase n=1 Tax=Neobacillus sp. D3-1R TaxID=3445778 RepID=UPI003FA1176B